MRAQQTQKPDPLTQAMQILQMVTQRRNQQAELEQGSRQLDLQEQQLQQRGEQFGQGLAWNREQAQMRQVQFDEELRQKMLDRALENTFRQQQFGVTAPYQQAITAKLQRDMARPEQDPQTMAVKQAQTEQLLAYLQNRMQMEPNPINRQRMQERIDALLERVYKDILPPMRDYTPDELKQIQTYQPVK